MRPSAAFLAALAALQGTTGLAVAEGFPLSVRTTPGVSLPLSEPQASTFGAGFDLQVGAALELAPGLDVEAHATYVLLSPSDPGPYTRPGTALGLGLGARYRVVLDGTRAVPWFGAGLDAMDSTGFRLLLTPAVGVQFPLPEDTAPVQLGPFVRYHHLFGLAAPAGYDSRDASILSLGLSVEWRDAPTPPPPPPPPPPG
ncbi:MAG: hypothetical protein FJ086_17090, partial [Deltaproteobacteria bacterium]|nr:hypothetical protein [Deltaproteobacteria bacterium]